MRPAPAAVLAAVAVLLLADLVVTEVVERRATAVLCGEPDVELGPWPVAPRVVAGGDVDITAELDVADVMALVAPPPLVAAVGIEDGRLHLVTTAGPTVPAVVSLGDGVIVVTPELGPFALDRLAIRIPLERLPDGLSLTAASVGEATITIAGRADPTRLRAGGPMTCPVPTRQRPGAARFGTTRRAQLSDGSSGKVAKRASSPGWRRRTSDQRTSGSSTNASTSRASATNQASAATSPSSCPGAQPA